MTLRPLLRAALWARRPPPARRVVLGLAVLALCLGLYALERSGLLPGWAGLPVKAPPAREAAG